MMRCKIILQLLGLSFAAAALIGATAWYSDDTSTVGLLGVLLGGAISTITSILLSREDRLLQLATAALEKRLAVHQEAYAIWTEIISYVHQPDKLGEVLATADKWWRNNCLYLDATSRQTFRSCIIMAGSHKDILQGPRGPDTKDLIKESWAETTRPGQTLVAGVSLPNLGDLELPERVRKEKLNKKVK